MQQRMRTTTSNHHYMNLLHTSIGMWCIYSIKRGTTRTMCVSTRIHYHHRKRCHPLIHKYMQTEGFCTVVLVWNGTTESPSVNALVYNINDIEWKTCRRVYNVGIDGDCDRKRLRFYALPKNVAVYSNCCALLSALSVKFYSHRAGSGCLA